MNTNKRRTDKSGTMNMPLASLLEQTAFDADTTSILTTAFDQAWSKVKPTDAALSNETMVRTALAKRIIDRATQGERNMDRLVEDAVDFLARSC
jgi:hypothetical protein